MLNRILLRFFDIDVEDYYPGILRDIFLSIPVWISSMIFLAYLIESHPARELKTEAMVSAIVILLGLCFAKKKAVIIGGVAGFIAIRGILLLLFTGDRRALLILIPSLLILFVIARFFPPNPPIEGCGKLSRMPPPQ